MNKGKQKATHFCEFCTDPLMDEDMITLPCNHECCQDCVRALFVRACQFEAEYPAMDCCRKSSLKIDEYQHLLTADYIALYKEKAEEYRTPVPRHYCSNSECQAFLRASDITADRGVCLKCSTVTCTMCDGRWHVNSDCPADSGLEMVLKLVEINKWTRCQKCRGVLTKKDGCNQVTCTFCGSGVCSSCGAAWLKSGKTCRCPNKILEQLHTPREVLDLTAYLAAQESVRRQDTIICYHGMRWERLDIRAQCEMCEMVMPDYIFHCRFCHAERCRMCIDLAPKRDYSKFL